MQQITGGFATSDEFDLENPEGEGFCLGREGKRPDLERDHWWEYKSHDTAKGFWKDWLRGRLSGGKRTRYASKRELFDGAYKGSPERALSDLQDAGEVDKTSEGWALLLRGGEECVFCQESLGDHLRCDSADCTSPVQRLPCPNCDHRFPIDPVPPHSGPFQCASCQAVYRYRLPETGRVEKNLDCPDLECEGTLRPEAGRFRCSDCGKSGKPVSIASGTLPKCPACFTLVRIHGDIYCPSCGRDFHRLHAEARVQWDSGGETKLFEYDPWTAKSTDELRAEVQETLDGAGVEEVGDVDLRVTRSIRRQKFFLQPEKISPQL